MIKKNIKGFTLIEIAIVLLIVSILLGYTVAMLPKQLELKQYKQAKQEMAEITESLYAFAQVNGYLPCPALIGVSNGFECRTTGAAGACAGNDPAANTCGVWAGIVPGKSLGIDGDYDINGALQDPWGEPYLYQVTNSDCEELGGALNTCTVANDGDGVADFVMANEMDLLLMPDLTPDLLVCSTDPTGAVANDTACASALTQLISTAPAVVSSSGKRNKGETSFEELENLDNGLNDTVFVSSAFSDSFDDLVRWISPNQLYSKMIESGALQ